VQYASRSAILVSEKFRSVLFCLTVLHITAAFGLSSNDDWNTLKAAQWFAVGGIGVAGKAGWSWGCVATVDSNGRTFIAPLLQPPNPK
jgi:hypothetical protein